MIFGDIYVYYSIIAIFIVNFLFEFPLYIYFYNRFYNQDKNIKKFYDDLYGINKLIFKSNKQFYRTVKINSFWYIVSWILLISLPISMANMADNPDEKYSIINLILFFSFIFFSILTYLIVILVYYFRIQRLAISEKEMIHNFQEFLDNWRQNKLLEEPLSIENSYFKKRFLLRQKRCFKYLDFSKASLKLGDKKTIMTDKNYYFKYLLLFSIYLNTFANVCKKWTLNLNEAESRNLKIIIINNFLNETY